MPLPSAWRPGLWLSHVSNLAPRTSMLDSVANVETSTARTEGSTPKLTPRSSQLTPQSLEVELKTERCPTTTDSCGTALGAPASTVPPSSSHRTARVVSAQTR